MGVEKSVSLNCFALLCHSTRKEKKKKVEKGKKKGKKEIPGAHQFEQIPKQSPMWINLSPVISLINFPRLFFSVLVFCYFHRPLADKLLGKTFVSFHDHRFCSCVCFSFHFWMYHHLITKINLDFLHLLRMLIYFIFISKSKTDFLLHSFIYSFCYYPWSVLAFFFALSFATFIDPTNAIKKKAWEPKKMMINKMWIIVVRSIEKRMSEVEGGWRWRPRENCQKKDLDLEWWWENKEKTYFYPLSSFLLNASLLFMGKCVWHILCCLMLFLLLSLALVFSEISHSLSRINLNVLLGQGRFLQMNKSVNKNINNFVDRKGKKAFWKVKPF